MPQLPKHLHLLLKHVCDAWCAAQACSLATSCVCVCVVCWMPQATQAGVRLRLMPHGLLRHASNTSRYNIGTSTLQWCVDWHWLGVPHAAANEVLALAAAAPRCAPPQLPAAAVRPSAAVYDATTGQVQAGTLAAELDACTVSTMALPSMTRLTTWLVSWLSAAHSNPYVPLLRRFVQALGPEPSVEQAAATLRAWVQHPFPQHGQTVYHPVPLHEDPTLQDVLKGKTIVEFPNIVMGLAADELPVWRDDHAEEPAAADAADGDGDDHDGGGATGTSSSDTGSACSDSSSDVDGSDSDQDDTSDAPAEQPAAQPAPSSAAT